tara:strand:- start:2338 stop:3579 length:1242 start_codon:yes stop_codon:yes gene_type:complete
MHKFFYPTKDSWINEASSSKNYGGDQILELKKEFPSTASPQSSSFAQSVTRILTQFDINEVSESLEKLTRGSTFGESNIKFNLRLYSSDSSHLQSEYSLEAFPLSSSWVEGTGLNSSKPIVQDGVTWRHIDASDPNKIWKLENNQTISGSRALGSGSEANGSGSQFGGTWYTGSTFKASQSFSYESPDVDMDVTDIVRHWISGSEGTTWNKSAPAKSGLPNYGFILKISGSHMATGPENDTSTMGLKFFSKNTHTIYTPKLEAKWDDRKGIADAIPSNYTSSFNELDLTGEVDNYLYVKGIKPYYKEDEIVKFRVGARKKNVGRTWSTSVQTITGSFIADKSGSYSIVDLTTGETIIPFGDYSMLSLDSGSHYFKQDLNTFQPNRFYKIMLKLKTDDNQEIIYDDNFEFKVVR